MPYDTTKNFISINFTCIKGCLTTVCYINRVDHSRQIKNIKFDYNVELMCSKYIALAAMWHVDEASVLKYHVQINGDKPFEG